MFLTTNTSPEAVKEETGGNYLNKSGVYDVTLKVVSVSVAASGAVALDFNIEYAGNTRTIYGTYIKDKKGQPMHNMKAINNLLVVLGLEGLNDPEEQVHVMGKDNKEVTLQVLDDLTDAEVKIKLQEVYSQYNGNISKKFAIKGFFRAEDGASADEIVNDGVVGTQLAKDIAYIEEKSPVTYENCTPEEVEAWKETFKKGSSAKAAPKAKAASTGKSGNLFG